MFGNNKVTHLSHGSGQLLRVVKGSPFLTIQGEGPYAGRAAVFVRLHGCNLRCWFCDTIFDNDSDPTISLDNLVERIFFVRGNARLVVITGGEPMLQNIYPLCNRLRELQFLVQIETAGTVWVDKIEDVAKIVVSPKTPSICTEAYYHADAFKYVISAANVASDSYVPVINTQPSDAPRRFLAYPRTDAPIYLSPMDEYDATKNADNLRAVSELALKYNLIAGVQLHKIFGVD